MNPTTQTAEALNDAYRKFCNSLSPDLKQRMNGRLERGLQIALSGGVKPFGNGHSPDQRLYSVASSNPEKPPYLVNLVTRSCACPDHWKGHYCKHRVAAQVFELAGMQLGEIPAPKAAPAEAQPEERSEGKTVIWACLRLDGKIIGVDVLGVEGDLIRIQALPAVTDQGKLEPQFPFPDGACVGLVPAGDLFHVNVFRNE